MRSPAIDRHRRQNATNAGYGARRRWLWGPVVRGGDSACVHETGPGPCAGSSPRCSRSWSSRRWASPPTGPSKPAETVSRANRPVPSPEPIKSIQYAELPSAPLIVEGRLRVYADQRRVFADTPVTAQREMTPHWAYRRWPAEVVSIVAVEKPGRRRRPLRRDHQVVRRRGRRPRRGEGRHRLAGPHRPRRRRDVQGPPHRREDRCTPRRTCSSPPPPLDHQPVVIATGKDVAQAIDPADGKIRWTHSFAATPGCHVRRLDQPRRVLREGHLREARDRWRCTTPAPASCSPRGARRVRRSAPTTSPTGSCEPTSCQLGRSGLRAVQGRPRPVTWSATPTRRQASAASPRRTGRSAPTTSSSPNSSPTRTRSSSSATSSPSRSSAATSGRSPAPPASACGCRRSPAP